MTPPAVVIRVTRQEKMAAPSDTIRLAIPGRSAARGEITHKIFADMNRKERRALLSNRGK